MKNIIVCCDGTGNDFGLENSNIVKLYALLKKDPERQVVYYDPGVGTPSTYSSFNPITRRLKYAFGAAFGYGISDNVMEACHFLMKNYEEGDRIYLFGFSRGAYTVRAIAGLIRTCGLLHDNNENLLPEAMRIYSEYNNYTNEDFADTFSRRCDIHFLGLFDTVSSVGWVYSPKIWRATRNNSRVKNVRHAIALDERRAFFRQNTWGRRHLAKQDVKEVWFAGVHSDVGGGYAPERSALSNIALEWMVREAMDKGVLIEDLDRARAAVNTIRDPHLADQNKSLTPAWYAGELFVKIVKVRKERPGKKARWVPLPYVNFGRRRYLRGEVHLHESVLQRLEGRADYRPKNLPELRDGVAAVREAYRERTEKWVRL